MKDKILSVSELYDIRDIYDAIKYNLVVSEFYEKSLLSMFNDFCNMYNYMYKNHNDVKVFYDKRYDLILELGHSRYNTKDYFVFEQYNPSSSMAPVLSDHRIVYQYKIDIIKPKVHEFIKIQNEDLKTTHIFESRHILAYEYKRLAGAFNIKEGAKLITIDKQIPFQYRVNEDKYSSTWIRIR